MTRLGGVGLAGSVVAGRYFFGTMKSKTTRPPAKPRCWTGDREDEDRGKTAVGKVRSEGRSLAAREKALSRKIGDEAASAKERHPGPG